MVDYESYADWIEIYNPQDTAFDLSGYYVTDNYEDPLKWMVPNGTIIEAQGYILLWADGHNDFPGNIHYRPFWPYEEFTTQRYHTNFKLSSLNEEIAIFKTVDVTSTSLISSGDEWKYNDNGEFYHGWHESDFQDSLWKSGISELGYGEGDEATVISFGGDAEHKHTTTYFRKKFDIDKPGKFQSISLRLNRDDGAVVYMNGYEITRSNVPEGEIFYDTFASEPIWNEYENLWHVWNIDIDLFEDGTNICGVEVHQYRPTSSDLSFDLEIIGKKFSDIVLVDSVSYPIQFKDVSYGRNPEDIDNWSYFDKPTPNNINDSPSVDIPKFSSEVFFSQEGGFFNNGISLELNSSDPDAAIAYTLDGTAPDYSSDVFETAIDIGETVVVKARSIEPDKMLGAISTHTYFINADNSDLPRVSLVTDPELLWGETYGIYANNLKQREIPVDIAYYHPGGETGFILRAGIKIGGLNIWLFPQKPLSVYVRERFGDDALNYKLFPSRNIGTFNRFVFRNGGDDWAAAMLRDAMTESIITNQMENGCQAYSPSVLYLNGSYWGIHNIREKFDSQYFAENFGISQMSYDHIEYNFVPSGPIALLAIEGSTAEWRVLQNFIESNDLADSSKYEYVKSQIDIDNFIDYLIIEQFAANTSWKHNREWWRPHTDDSKWQWLIPDLDKGYLLDNLELNLFTSFKNNYLLFHYILDNNEFVQIFANRFSAHLNSTFSQQRMVEIIDSLKINVSAEMPQHIERWGGRRRYFFNAKLERQH